LPTVKATKWQCDTLDRGTEKIYDDDMNYIFGMVSGGVKPCRNCDDGANEEKLAEIIA